MNKNQLNLDRNGRRIRTGSIVHWHDEAGKDENGNDIEFTVVGEEVFDKGYFNIAFADEKYPERWAWHEELTVIQH